LFPSYSSALFLAFWFKKVVTIMLVTVYTLLFKRVHRLSSLSWWSVAPVEAGEVQQKVTVNFSDEIAD
jgi:hypothetical protein